ncbi:MAG: hypothetical protein ACYC56_05475 [Candidatus Aquicultor sp.]
MEPYKKARLVYCLSMGMVESNSSDREASKSRHDRFNVLLAEQIKSHSEGLGLTDVLLKFNGDVWLLMTDKAQNLAVFSCLATIMAESFQPHTAQATGIAVENVPSLRLSICSGRDRFIELPDGRKDWVGDSARRALSASAYCHPNEVLLDDPSRHQVLDVFESTPADIQSRTLSERTKQLEEGFVAYTLGAIKVEQAAESHAPENFVYTFGATGKMDEAARVAQRVAERLVDEAKGAVVAEMPGWNRLIASLLDYASAVKVLPSIQVAGLTPDLATYNALIAKADFGEGRSLLDAVQKEGIKPNCATYNALISKADFDTAVSLFEAMQKEGIKPDLATYNGIIPKAPDFDTIQPWFERMLAENIQPGVVIYNTLITKSPDHDTAGFWFKKLLDEGIQPNIITYNALIAKAPNYGTASYWLEAILEDSIQSNLATYNRLIAKAPDYTTVKALLEALLKEGIKPNVITYNALISKSPDYDKALLLLEAMRKDGVAPNVDSFSRLFSKNLSGKSAEDVLALYQAQGIVSEEPIQTVISTYRKVGRVDQALLVALEYPHLVVAKKLIREIMDDVFAYLETIREEGPADVASYNTLISKAPNYNAAKSWVDTMRKKDIRPDLITYNALISKSIDFGTAKTWLEAMRADGIAPDIESYSGLFGKDLSGTSADELLGWYLAQEYHPEEPIQVAITSYRKTGHVNQALRLALEFPQLQSAKTLVREIMNDMFDFLATMRDEGVQPNVATYSALISKAPYYSIAESWLATMRNKGIEPNTVTYNTLISKAPDYDTGKSWLEVMKKENVKPSVVTYSTLIAKADFGTGTALLDEMKREGIMPNTITYNALVLKAPDYPTVQSLLATMRQDHIKPDVVTYNTLMLAAPDYDTAKVWLDEMRKDGLQPNIVTYNRLFSKNLSAKPADEIVTWYLSQNYHPDEPVQAAIAAYQKSGRIDQALRLVLEYPHLQVARKLIREHTDQALAYLKNASGYTQRHPNLDYALGLAFMEKGKRREAEPHLKKAIAACKPGPRRAVLEEYLRQTERELTKMA